LAPVEPKEHEIPKIVFFLYESYFKIMAMMGRLALFSIIGLAFYVLPITAQAGWETLFEGWVEEGGEFQVVLYDEPVTVRIDKITPGGIWYSEKTSHGHGSGTMFPDLTEEDYWYIQSTGNQYITHMDILSLEDKRVYIRLTGKGTIHDMETKEAVREGWTYNLFNDQNIMVEEVDGDHLVFTVGPERYVLGVGESAVYKTIEPFNDWYTAYKATVEYLGFVDGEFRIMKYLDIENVDMMIGEGVADEVFNYSAPDSLDFYSLELETVFDEDVKDGDHKTVEYKDFKLDFTVDVDDYEIQLDDPFWGTLGSARAHGQFMHVGIIETNLGPYTVVRKFSVGEIHGSKGHLRLDAAVLKGGYEISQPSVSMKLHLPGEYLTPGEHLLNMTVANTGVIPLRNLTATIYLAPGKSDPRGLSFNQTSYYVGDLAVGEEVTFPVLVVTRKLPYKGPLSGFGSENYGVVGKYRDRHFYIMAASSGDVWKGYAGTAPWPTESIYVTTTKLLEQERVEGEKEKAMIKRAIYFMQVAIFLFLVLSVIALFIRSRKITKLQGSFFVVLFAMLAAGFGFVGYIVGNLLFGLATFCVFLFFGIMGYRYFILPKASLEGAQEEHLLVEGHLPYRVKKDPIGSIFFGIVALGIAYFLPGAFKEDMEAFLAGLGLFVFAGLLFVSNTFGGTVLTREGIKTTDFFMRKHFLTWHSIKRIEKESMPDGSPYIKLELNSYSKRVYGRGSFNIPGLGKADLGKVYQIIKGMGNQPSESYKKWLEEERRLLYEAYTNGHISRKLYDEMRNKTFNIIVK
jgi:hypothetical protein